MVSVMYRTTAVSRQAASMAYTAPVAAAIKAAMAGINQVVRMGRVPQNTKAAA